ncbi:cytochrome c1 [Legionella sp. km772]|uniref:cytochrome c1 n=1 Tax=Legionella sp. km772 TaxID=2498111 RepID=UPI0013157CB5|nr:cytochrome c1 [Legionella sp. km772]
MKKRLNLILFILGVLGGYGCFALPSMDSANKASLQRGAALFVNYCSGCHSLKYFRYEQLASDLAIPPNLVKDNLIFTESKLNEPFLIALQAKDAQEWFGVVPPDLSLIARQRGKLWLYRYLTGFYKDHSRPMGVNNTLLPNVAMPDVLEPLKGTPEQLNEHFKQELGDLINFLDYVGEPAYFSRIHLGPYVVLFFILLFIPVYLLKRLYWSDLGS